MMQSVRILGEGAAVAVALVLEGEGIRVGVRMRVSVRVTVGAKERWERSGGAGRVRLPASRRARGHPGGRSPCPRRLPTLAPAPWAPPARVRIRASKGAELARGPAPSAPPADGEVW